MTTTGGVEQFKLSVAATFQAYLATEIANESAAWNDGLPLLVPASNQIFPYFAQSVDNLPALFLVALESPQTANMAPTYGAQDHHVDAVIAVESDDDFALDRMVDRYIRAMWRVIMQHQGLDGMCSGLSGVDCSIGYSVVQRNQTLLQKQGGLHLVGHVMEWAS